MIGSHKHESVPNTMHVLQQPLQYLCLCCDASDCLSYALVLAAPGNGMPCGACCEATLLWHAGWWTRLPGSS